MPFLVGTLVGGCLRGLNAKKHQKMGVSHLIIPYFWNLFILFQFFLLDRFKSVLSTCSENLAAFGTHLVPLWTKTARGKNRDFQFDNPPLTACNLTHGQDTICLSIFAHTRRMGLSNGVKVDPPGAPPFEDNWGGLTFFQKKSPKFKKTGRNARGSL